MGFPRLTGLRLRAAPDEEGAPRGVVPGSIDRLSTSGQAQIMTGNALSAQEVTVQAHTQAGHIDLPRPRRLLWTVGWSFTESIGLPAVGYVLGQALGGRDGAMLGATVVLGLIAVARKVVTGGVPGLVTITGLVMAGQAAIAVSTGSVLFFLIQFPLGNLALAVLFARTAPTGTPLVAQLAAEIVGLHPASLRHPGLSRFFQGVTWLWASLFFLMTVGFSVMMITERLTQFLVLTTAVTVGTVIVGAGFSAVWFSAAIRASGLRIRLATA